LLLEALKGGDQEVATLAAFAFKAVDPVSPEVVRALGHALLGSTVDAKYAICGKFASLGRMAAPALPELVGELRRGGKHRWYAIEGIKAVGLADREAVLALCAALQDKDDDVRLDAARCLERLGPAVRQVLVRKGEVEVAVVVPALIHSLGDRN